MSKFKTLLRVEQIDDESNDGRGSWKLLAPLVYQSDVAETVFVVPTDFITDYASVPRIPIAFWLTGDTAHAAAVIHDFLYTTQEVTRDIADAVLQEAAIVAGVPAWRAWLLWAGVRLGGGSHWENRTENLFSSD